jgi:hypothetical protein
MVAKWQENNCLHYIPRSLGIVGDFIIIQSHDCLYLKLNLNRSISLNLYEKK